MTNKLKTALGAVVAEESLKESTLDYLARQRQKAPPPRRRGVRQLAAAAVLCLVLAGGFTGRVYFTPSAYVDLDVNPSMELTLNPFDRVIGAYAYNDEGRQILDTVNLVHRGYTQAVETLVDAMAQQGYLAQDGLISVTLQVEDDTRQTQMLSSLASAVLTHHPQTQLDAFAVDSAQRTAAHDLALTPAKYLAIQELQQVDPTATVEGCRNHSISELRQLTKSHAAGHGNAHQGGGADTTAQGQSAQPNQSAEGHQDDAKADYDQTLQTGNGHMGQSQGGSHNSGHGGGKGHG